MCPIVAVKAKAKAVAMAATCPGGSSLILEHVEEQTYRIWVVHTVTKIVEENVDRYRVVELTASSLAGREGRRHGLKKQEQSSCQVDSPHRRGLAERHEWKKRILLLRSFLSVKGMIAYFRIIFFLFYIQH
jgi:hypothetical protein